MQNIFFEFDVSASELRMPTHADEMDDFLEAVRDLRLKLHNLHVIVCEQFRLQEVGVPAIKMFLTPEDESNSCPAIRYIEIDSRHAYPE